MSLKGLRFTLEIDGQEPDTFAVVNFRLIQNQSYPFVMSADVASDSFMQTAEMLLEKKATLTIWQGAVAQRYVTGVVAGFGMQENNGWQMRYHLRIEPPLWRCGLRQNFRIFQQQDKGSGFNELRFEDATDKEQVYIHAQKNMDMEVLNDRTTDVKHDHTETIGNDQKITVGLGQTVNVGSKKEGGHDQKVTVANDQHLTIKNDRHKVVNNNQTSKVTGTDTEEVVKKQRIKIGDNYELKVEHGTKIISGDSIELICGQGESGTCSIKLEKTGKIIIQGTEFLFEATGPVDIKGKDIHLNG